jgi:hypothetical protein
VNLQIGSKLDLTTFLSLQETLKLEKKLLLTTQLLKRLTLQLKNVFVEKKLVENTSLLQTGKRRKLEKSTEDTLLLTLKK